MLAPATMRLCNNAVLALLLAGARRRCCLHSKPAQSPAPAPPLTVDRDPVRSPDLEPPAPAAGPLSKEGGGYVLHTDVEEVVLNATVLDVATTWSRT